MDKNEEKLNQCPYPNCRGDGNTSNENNAGSHRTLKNCPLLQKHNNDYLKDENVKLTVENHKLSNVVNLNVDCQLREDFKMLKEENIKLKYISF